MKALWAVEPFHQDNSKVKSMHTEQENKMQTRRRSQEKKVMMTNNFLFSIFRGGL